MDSLPFPTWVDQRWLLKVAVALCPMFGFFVADIIGWSRRRITRERHEASGPSPAEPMVRILFPPALSPLRTSLSGGSVERSAETTRDNPR